MVTQTLTATGRATSTYIENHHAMLVSTAAVVVNVALGSGRRPSIHCDHRPGQHLTTCPILPKYNACIRRGVHTLRLCRPTAAPTVTFQNGSGLAPSATSVPMIDAETLTVEVSGNNGGARKPRYWDVVVTLANGVDNATAVNRFHALIQSSQRYLAGLSR